VVRIINSLTNTKFDPRVVAAITAVFEKGLLRLHRAGVVTAEQAADPVPTGAPAVDPRM
jgi:hypothetical protein